MYAQGIPKCLNYYVITLLYIKNYCTVAFIVVKKFHIGAFYEPERLRWLRLDLNKAKAFVQAE